MMQQLILFMKLRDHNCYSCIGVDESMYINTIVNQELKQMIESYNMYVADTVKAIMQFMKRYIINEENITDVAINNKICIVDDGINIIVYVYVTQI